MASAGGHYCWSGRARYGPIRDLDVCTGVDGRSLLAQRQAVRTHSLPLHWSILPSDDCANVCVWLWRRFGGNARLANVGLRHIGRQQTLMVAH